MLPVFFPTVRFLGQSLSSRRSQSPCRRAFKKIPTGSPIQKNICKFEHTCNPEIRLLTSGLVFLCMPYWSHLPDMVDSIVIGVKYSSSPQSNEPKFLKVDDAWSRTTHVRWRLGSTSNETFCKTFLKPCGLAFLTKLGLKTTFSSRNSDSLPPKSQAKAAGSKSETPEPKLEAKPEVLWSWQLGRSDDAKNVQETMITSFLHDVFR